jgi:hypothetical protein
MPKPQGYEPVLAGQSASLLTELPKSKQREVISLLYRLSAVPSQVGDYTTEDDTSRSLQNILLGPWHITYWADHAAQEFRIVDITEV